MGLGPSCVLDVPGDPPGMRQELLCSLLPAGAVAALRSLSLSAFQLTLTNLLWLFPWQYRAWIRRDYGRNPFQDQEELQGLLGQQQEEGRDRSWLRSPAPTFPPPCRAGASAAGSRWMNR